MKPIKTIKKFKVKKDWEISHIGKNSLNIKKIIKLIANCWAGTADEAQKGNKAQK